MKVLTFITITVQRIQLAVLKLYSTSESDVVLCMHAWCVHVCVCMYQCAIRRVVWQVLLSDQIQLCLAILTISLIHKRIIKYNFLNLLRQNGRPMMKLSGRKGKMVGNGQWPAVILHTVFGTVKVRTVLVFTSLSSALEIFSLVTANFTTTVWNVHSVSHWGIHGDWLDP